MRLFDVDPSYRIILNKDWLYTIPQFKKLIQRDKGSPGDYDGRLKKKAIKEFTFIYHNVDPRSPIENLEEYERMERALQYAELTEADIDAAVLDAQDEYMFLIENSSPSIPLLRAAKGANAKLIDYWNKIDFNQKNSKGDLIHSPMQHIKNVSMLKNLHESTVKFEEIVLNELKNQKGTRGKTQLTQKEKNAEKIDWQEGTMPVAKPTAEDVKAHNEEAKRINAKAPSFMQIAELNENLLNEDD